jgi:hypothetical protein
VEIAVEVEVDVLHRDYLRASAARRAAFHAKAWAKRRLAQADDRFDPDPVETVG